MITKNDLKPTELQRVRAVAQAAGFSIDGWASNDRHKNSRWCFGNAREAREAEAPTPLVFAWWKNLQEDSNGNVYFLNDTGDWADKCRRRGKSAAAGKADEFNNLVNACYYGNQPVRVAIVDGDADPTDDDADEKASKRQLDDALWYPHHRDTITGWVVIMRGVPQQAGFDPNAEYAASMSPSLSRTAPILPPPAGPDSGEGAGWPETSPEAEGAGAPPERVTSTTTTYPRDSEIVKMVKLRVVDGKCECCGEQGFLTARGGYYLEVHHVIPLSCGGVDAEWNALAICPHEHRSAHFGANRNLLRDKMVQLLGDRYPQKLEKLLEMTSAMDSQVVSGQELEATVES